MSKRKRRINLRKSHSSLEVIRILKRDGWILKNAESDHWHFVHPVKTGKVTVTHPEKDIPPKTLRSILEQAGLL